MVVQAEGKGRDPVRAGRPAQSADAEPAAPAHSALGALFFLVVVFFAAVVVFFAAVVVFFLAVVFRAGFFAGPLARFSASSSKAR